MLVLESEAKILLKILDICYISLDDEVSTRLLYDLMNKRYLWNCIKSLLNKGLITIHKDGRCNMIQFTSNGKRVAKALNTIKNV